jgi:acyl-[acyl carrier protein]--UDP-N-acetylglucosamine O-acyltransferase
MSLSKVPIVFNPPAPYVGLPPQHLKADPTVGELNIGDRVTIRETATVNRSTHPCEQNATRITDDCSDGRCAHRA